MHTCIICDEKFPVWMAYHIHMEMTHTKPAARVCSRKRFLGGVKAPKSDSELMALVAKGEGRLGMQHFVGFGVKENV